MEKRVIVVNGRGGVGKDTVCAAAAKSYRVCNISSITPIVEIAKKAGWDGKKTPASRRLLSKLKEAFTEFNDLSFSYCMKQYHAFMQSDAQILFVHIREPEEITRFRRAVGADCRTLLVRRQACEQRGLLGNRSDDHVGEYEYDYVFYNEGVLNQLEESVGAFFAHVLAQPKDEGTPIVWYFENKTKA